MLAAIFASMLAVMGGVQYASPVNYQVTLAGNFGEPRPNHFHGGIDVKTEGVQGKHIYAIGDGYVSRLTVGYYGFGNAVYITHPEGYTSVYCHLKRFSPRLERMVKRTGKPLEQIDLHFKPTDLPVAQGQLIAISGNTGASKAPHLHLEIHHARNGHMLDPLDFLGHCVSDTVAPQAFSFMAYPMAGEGTFCGSSQKQNYGFGGPQGNRTYHAWGKVGFGIWAHDYMQEVYNPFGVHEIVMLVDGREAFHAVIDRIPPFANRQVNAWGDYDHWRRYRTWYMRSYVPDEVDLPFLQADDQRGVVCFDEERPYQMEYVLRDAKGNESHYRFIVVGQRQQIPPHKAERHNISHDRLSVVSRPGMTLVVPARVAQQRMMIEPRIEAGALSPRYTFSLQPCPLLGWAELSIAVRQRVADPSRLYISSGNHDMGGVYHDGWVTTLVRDLDATYELKLRNK